MANTSRLQTRDADARAVVGFPLLSLDLSQHDDLRSSSSTSLAPVLPVVGVSLGLSVPSLPQSYAPDDALLSRSTSPQQQRAESNDIEQHAQQQQSAVVVEQKEDGQPAEASDEDEPTWETVHHDDTAAHDVVEGEYISSAVEDSLGAMALSLFDDGSQLPADDMDAGTHAPRFHATQPQRNLLSSLPAFPSLPSGLRTPPPFVPATPSPPSVERLSPATGSGRSAAAAGLLTPRSPDVVLSSITPSPPPSPQGRTACH